MKLTLASSPLFAALVLLSSASPCAAQLGGMSGSVRQAPAPTGPGVPGLQTVQGQWYFEYPSQDNSRAPNSNWAWPPQNLVFAWIDEASRNSGMTLASADPALRAHLALAKAEGLIVTALDPVCPAAAAGIQVNDVLIHLDDRERSVSLAKPEDLEKGLKEAGERPVTLVLRRGGKEVRIKVQPRLRASLGPEPSRESESLGYWIGVQVAPVEPALRAQLQLHQDQGVIVVEVVKDSPAARAAVEVHDIFLRINDVAVKDTETLTKLVQSHGDRTLKIDLVRAGRTGQIGVTPERRKNSHRLGTVASQPTQFDVVLPGAVIAGKDRADFELGDALRTQLDAIISQRAEVLKSSKSVNVDKPSADSTKRDRPGPSVEQRLDDLSAQMKDLRAAIDALAKAAERK